MKPKYLIIDLFGVLFLLNKQSILRQLGIWNLLKFYSTYRTSPLEHCLALLNQMRLSQEEEFQGVVAYKDFFLPKSLCLWQKGLLDNDKALSRICTYLDSISQQSCYDRATMKKVAGIIFSAQSLIPALKLNTSFYKQLLALKESGYALILFSNIDPQTWKHIQTSYPKNIEIFDGTVTSAESHLIKPDKEIFDHLLKKYDLAPNDCLLIDDQLENCDAAKNIGISYIHYAVGKRLKL